MSNTNENVNTDVKEIGRKPRGFAALTPERRRELGSRGGKTAHERGTANQFTSESAREAGRIPHERGTAYKWTSEEARNAASKRKNIRKQDP